MFTGILRDITEREQAAEMQRQFTEGLEQRVRERTVELEHLYATVPVGLVLIDTEYRFVQANEAAATIYGKSIKQHLGYRVRDVIPELADQMETILSRVFSSGELALNVEIKGALPTDPETTGYWLTSYYPMKSDDGEVQAVNAVFQNITDRKHADEELSKSEAHYRNLTESIDQFVYRADPKTFAAIFANSAVAGLYGFTMEEWLNDTALWRKSLYPDDRERVLAEFSELKKKVESGVIRYRIRTKDQTVRWIEDHVSWEKDEQGNVISMNGMMYDVTERKRLEQDVLDIGERERRRLGEDLHDDLGQQLAGIGFLAEELAQQLDRKDLALEAGKLGTINKLVTQSITRSRDLARGLYPIEIASLGFEVVIRALAKPSEAIYGIACVVLVDQHLGIDEDRVGPPLYRIAQEAITNAMRHGNANRIAISLKMEGAQVVMIVEDDGSGLPDDFGESEGMGLRIMRHRARTIDATLEVCNAPGGGTIVKCAI
jgi:PAS domain S-box-containing protein